MHSAFRFPTIVLVVVFLCAGRIAQATPVQWTSGTGANGHFYDRINQTGLTYPQAVAAAATSTFNGLPGHLVIFDNNNYTNEFNFVDTNVYAPGVSDSRIYWAGASWDGVTGTNRDHWFWLDGSNPPTSITNTWNIDQAEGPGPDGIAFFQTNSHTLWDYIETNSSNFVSGYVVEFEPVPEPAMSLAIGSIGAAMILRRKR